MSAIMDDGEAPRDAARDYLLANDEVLGVWLEGVTTREGDDAAVAVREALSN